MDQIPAMLAVGRLDVAYLRPPLDYPEGIQAVSVYQDEFVLAIPEDSPLADHACVTPRQLRDLLSFALPVNSRCEFALELRQQISPVLAG